MIETRTILLAMHLLGLVLGLGAAVLLDLQLLRLLRGQAVGAFEATLVRRFSVLIGVGLALLWVSGAGLVWLALQANPDALGNPKLQAKLAVVLLLTVNGVALHGRVLPLFERNLGRPLFADIGSMRALLCLTHGAVSASAWGFAFVCGAVRELNFAAELWRFLAAYGVLLALATAAILLVYRPGVAAQARGAAVA